MFPTWADVVAHTNPFRSKSFISFFLRFVFLKIQNEGKKKKNYSGRQTVLRKQ